MIFIFLVTILDMNKDELIDVVTELAQYANELAKDSGVPGVKWRIHG